MNDSKKGIVRSWEKRRLVYNLVLLVEGLWVLREHLAAAMTQFWGFMVLFAIAANVCYCLGPYLEICVRSFLGPRADRTHYQSFFAVLRYFLFWVGLLFSMWWVWMWSLRGLDHLGGSVHYIYRTEFRDQTLAFVSFLALAFALYLALSFLFRLITMAKGGRT
jgi:hypothetical protein